MESAISPAGVLLGLAQYQGPGGAHDSRSSWALRRAGGCVVACDQVAVPAQHRVRTYQQPQPTQHLQRQPVQQRRQECAIARSEPHLVLTELALRHRNLMAQGQDLHVLVPAGHRQQAQHGERVRHAQIDQSQQHGRSCRVIASCARAPTLSTVVDTPANQLSPGRMRLSATAPSGRVRGDAPSGPTNPKQDSRNVSRSMGQIHQQRHHEHHHCQSRLMLSTRSSSGPGSPRPSVLFVSIHSEPSGARATSRRRPNSPTKCSTEVLGSASGISRIRWPRRFATY